jgi:hypothetical protein
MNFYGKRQGWSKTGPAQNNTCTIKMQRIKTGRNIRLAGFETVLLLTLDINSYTLKYVTIGTGCWTLIGVYSMNNSIIISNFI